MILSYYNVYYCCLCSESPIHSLRPQLFLGDHTQILAYMKVNATLCIEEKDDGIIYQLNEQTFIPQMYTKRTSNLPMHTLLMINVINSENVN